MTNQAYSAQFEAKFPMQDRAIRFAERISEPGWWARDVVQRGRTVTFTVEVSAKSAQVTPPSTLFLDYLGTVGYFGSDQRRKATLSMNGGPPRRAPIEY